ncbi:MAG: NUDIX hydrolase [Zoogloeaceae bacterium]|jgi:ADP-ribose pyrophosphatase YjhB (NUDIX family)|nr:NUDIX hydrolase [Zoogloeaceae bacterium]
MDMLSKAHVKAHTRAGGMVRVRSYDTRRGGAPLSLFGGWSAFFQEKKTSQKHPQKGEFGEGVFIRDPDEATDAASWRDGERTAVFVPGGLVPEELNGVPFSSWKDYPKTSGGWEYLQGLFADIEEPDMELPIGKRPAAGVVVEEPDGRVWVVHPTNNFFGVRASFPKGHVDGDMSLQATALKECFEETGLKVRITGFIGDQIRSGTITRYYRAERVGGSPAEMGWESQAVSLAPRSEVAALMTGYDLGTVKMSGFPLYRAARQIDGWRKISDQLGSNRGGVFEDISGKRYYCKFPHDEDIARNEVLSGALYRLCGVYVPKTFLVMGDGGTLGVASEMVDGARRDAKAATSGELPGVFDGFAADAWLANWDVAGSLFDNLLVAGNRALRVDAGGALLFRAGGEKKPFGSKVPEVDSLRDKGINPFAFAVFKKIKTSDIVRGVERIAEIPNKIIRKTVMRFGAGDRSERLALANTLIARKEDLRRRFLRGNA